MRARDFVARARHAIRCGLLTINLLPPDESLFRFNQDPTVHKLHEYAQRRCDANSNDTEAQGWLTALHYLHSSNNLVPSLLHLATGDPQRVIDAATAVAILGAECDYWTISDLTHYRDHLVGWITLLEREPSDDADWEVGRTTLLTALRAEAAGTR
jgi:hypothetical protein